jgi:coenzyme Q-binding protein COQ10
MPGAKQSIIIEAPIKTVYDVIIDFEQYPKFLSESKKATILEKKAKSLTAEFEIRVIKKLRYTLKFNLTPGKKVVWSFVEGDLFNDNKGSWTLKALSKTRTEATYNVDVELGILVPKSITNMLVGSNLPNMLESFKKRIEMVHNK